MDEVSGTWLTSWFRRLTSLLPGGGRSSNTPSPTSTPLAPPPQPTTGGTWQAVWVTFYAARDNDPSGSREIAYPGPTPRHAQATADLGTFDHPITLASAVAWLPVGTRVYVPRFRKYYIMEDQCVTCENDWSQSRLHHVDLYMSNSVQPGVIACEDAATRGKAQSDTIQLNPPPGLPVDTTPLYTDTGGCVQAAHSYV